MSEPEKIPTSLRTLRILEVIAASETALTPTEINSRLGLPKQTAHRLCARLVAEGYIAYVPGGKRLRPARRLRTLAAGLMSASQVHIARHQILEDVARQVGETVNFVVPEELGMSYLDRVETGWAFRVQLPVGTSVPFHCTASGKTFMASLPLAARKAFVSALTLKPWTLRTHTDPGALLDDLGLIAKRGYALDDEEFVEGMVAIAVPVRDSNGRFIAALAFHGPAQRVSIKAAESKRDVLISAAQRLTDALFS